MGNCCSDSMPSGGIKLGSNPDNSAPSSPSNKQPQKSALDAAEKRQKDKEGTGALAKKLKAQNAVGPGRSGAVNGANDRNMTGADYQ